MFNAEAFCFEYNIAFAPRGHQHRRKGWVNVICPYCTGTHFGYHLGINTLEGWASCYRCGGHWLPKVVATLAKVPIQEAFRIIKRHSSGELLQEYNEIVSRKEKLEFPECCGTLQSMHWKYLKSRNFKASVAREWELMGTGIHGPYNFRIIAPIRLDGILISYQGRDITDKSKMRYKNCSAEDEVYPHKHVIYGIDKCKGKRILVVEGITDAWRIGPGCGATFGINWSPPQARLIASRFEEFIILYDNEEQAQEKALALYQYLTARGVDGEIATINIGKDPGGLTEKQAQEIKGDFGIK
ncbi:MAG: hypothetical protein WDA09_02335 [Bacteriovoracaceae bacterium]